MGYDDNIQVLSITTLMDFLAENGNISPNIVKVLEKCSKELAEAYIDDEVPYSPTDATDYEVSDESIWEA